MNRVEAMKGLGDALGVSPIPDTLAGLVAAAGGTRAAAILMGAPSSIPTRPANGPKFSAEERAERNQLLSPQRTLQRYMKAESGATGKNVRGQKEADRKVLTDKLHGLVAQQQKAKADAKRPRGFHAKVKGNFFVSSSTYHRQVKPVYIDRAAMDDIIDRIQDGDYSAAAASFSDSYGFSYLVTSMQWGENDEDPDAFDSLVID